MQIEDYTERHTKLLDHIREHPCITKEECYSAMAPFMARRTAKRYLDELEHASEVFVERGKRYNRQRISINEKGSVGALYMDVKSFNETFLRILNKIVQRYVEAHDRLFPKAKVATEITNSDLVSIRRKMKEFSSKGFERQREKMRKYLHLFREMLFLYRSMEQKITLNLLVFYPNFTVAHRVLEETIGQIYKMIFRTISQVQKIIKAIFLFDPIMTKSEGIHTSTLLVLFGTDQSANRSLSIEMKTIEKSWFNDIKKLYDFADSKSIALYRATA